MVLEKKETRCQRLQELDYLLIQRFNVGQLRAVYSNVRSQLLKYKRISKKAHVVKLSFG